MNDTPQATMPIGRHDARTAPPLHPQNGQHPYPPAAPTGGPQAPAFPPADQPQPIEPPAQAEPVQREPGPLTQWWQAARTDSAARKNRGGNAWWLMRWMREQPTSVADHLDYYLHQREERSDGRRGWGLQTAIPLINGVHAAFYGLFGVTVGLAATLAFYALAWMCQRPGRAFLLAIAAVIVHTNLSTWLAGS